MRNNYGLEKLAYNNGNYHIGVDESLFTHANGNHIWIVGLLNHETNKLRLELVESRNAEILKYIIEKHIGTGNIIITDDGWNDYSFLDRLDSRYIHHTYNYLNSE